MKRPEDMTREELIEEVTYLRGDDRQQAQLRRDRLQVAFGIPWAEAEVLGELVRASGRTVQNWALADASPPQRMHSDRNDAAVVKAWICRLRKRLGADAIETVHGAGYRLTSAGIALVDAALGKTPEQQRSA